MRKKLKILLSSLFVAIGILAVVSVTMPQYGNALGAGAVDCKAQGLENLTEKDDPTQKTCCPPGHSSSVKECLFAKYINPTVNLLSAVAAIAAIIGMVVGGIQYASSAGDPQKASAGKTKVVKALYGLMAFLFLYSALQFLSPGGFSSNASPRGGGGSVAAQCSKQFLGLKPWFAYLPNDAFGKDPVTGARTCDIDNFTLIGDGKSKSNLPAVLLAVADDLVRVAGLVAVAFVITGGVQYVVSQGEPDRTKRAKDTIINALIGLVIAILAASVVSFIGNRLS